MVPELKKLGLSNSEIRVYIKLLEIGVSSPPRIAKEVGIARPNIYNTLKSLLDEGLIEKHKKGKRYVYSAKDPEAMLRVLEEKREAVEQILPDLKALHRKRENKPVINFYDGWNEVKNIYLKALNSEVIYFLGSLESFRAQDQKFFNDYQKKLEKNKVIVKDILTDDQSSKAARISKKEIGKLYEQISILNKKDNIPTDIVIWSDSVALISFKDPVFATVLENKELAKTFKIIFELLWVSANRKTKSGDQRII